MSTSHKLAVHEGFALNDFLVRILQFIGRDDLLEHSRLYDPRNTTTNSFEVEYTIPRTPDHDIQLNSAAGFKTMVDDVVAATQRSPLLVLVIRELLVRVRSLPVMGNYR